MGIPRTLIQIFQLISDHSWELLVTQKSSVQMKTAKTRLRVNGWCNFRAIFTVWSFSLIWKLLNTKLGLVRKSFKNLVITAFMRDLLAWTAGQIQFRCTLPNFSLILPIIKHRQFVLKPSPKGVPFERMLHYDITNLTACLVDYSFSKQLTA